MNDFKYEPLSLERIQAEQDKHKLGLIAHGIPQVDLSDKSIEDCDSITMAIQDIAKRSTEEHELYIICEMAKLYVESQRPAKWVKEYSETGALGIKYTWFKCSKCGWSRSLAIPKNFCPNCGKRMIIDKESNNEDNKANSNR